jgi:hypothetical protein
MSNAINTYKFTLTSDIYHEATKRNKTANVEVIETKYKIGYSYTIQIRPTYSIRRKSYNTSSLFKKDARKLAEKCWQKYLNE